MTGQTQFASGDVLIVADDFAIEVFHRSYERSFRQPTAWLGVRTEAKKHDEFEVKFGTASPLEQPIYGEDVNLNYYAVVFELPNAVEPQLRAFFADVAGRAGRMA